MPVTASPAEIFAESSERPPLPAAGLEETQPRPHYPPYRSSRLHPNQSASPHLSGSTRIVGTSLRRARRRRVGFRSDDTATMAKRGNRPVCRELAVVCQGRRPRRVPVIDRLVVPRWLDLRRLGSRRYRSSGSLQCRCRQTRCYKLGFGAPFRLDGTCLPSAQADAGRRARWAGLSLRRPAVRR